MGVATESDAVLVAAARSGDEQASGELFQRHHGAVMGYARGLVRDQHTAEDLASEAFARTFAALRDGLGPREACRPYLYAVVRNTAVDWARAGRRTVVTDEVAQWADRPADEPPDVDEKDALVRAFRSLPERWQTVLWYTVVEDEPVQRVADLLGLRAGAVAQLSFRAREGLRKAFLAASVGDRPECAEYTGQLAATVRHPARRRSRALRRHMDVCERCRRASAEMVDLNGRLRMALPIGLVVLEPSSGSLGDHLPVAALAGWPAKAAMAGAGALVLTIVITTLGGGDPDGPPRAAPPPATVPAAPAEPSPGPRPATRAPEAVRAEQPAPRAPRNGGGGTARVSAPARNAAGTPSRIRNTTLQSCLAPDGGSVVQRACSGANTTWRRRDTAGGFTLRSSATGRCMTRGTRTAGVPWEGGAQYTVTTAPCGGADQVWKLVQFSPGVQRLANGDGWYLQASWSGLRAVTLKPSSFAGMAAQGWSVNATG
ncbi:RNA polymerase sigma factor [Actinomadura flavalba]|uniref:RNA polymerase sigma factor n=1 Tax=Actinomadura flavalba TaxID=1120938 RepID=UPI0009DB8641|nr:RNA polymerase sigma factor [Actinomadura flavalba]